MTVIEVTPKDDIHWIEAAFDAVKRGCAILFGALFCIVGVCIVILPGFDVEAMDLMKPILGGILLAMGYLVASIGSEVEPVELVFDRRTEEWKMATDRIAENNAGLLIERIAPRGSVLTLDGNKAAIRDQQSQTVLKMHVKSKARGQLISEMLRLEAAA